MSLPNPSIEPSQIIQGDSLQWTRAWADFPSAAGWQLSYYLNGTANKSILWGTHISAGGDDFQILVPAATTATWGIGNYWWAALVVTGPTRAQVASGQMLVKVNPATLATPFDGRTHVQKVLDAIQATLEGNVTREESSIAVAFGGVTRQLQFFGAEELYAVRRMYLRERADEVAAENAAAGRATGRRILNRYVSPS